MWLQMWLQMWLRTCREPAVAGRFRPRGIAEGDGADCHRGRARRRRRRRTADGARGEGSSRPGGGAKAGVAAIPFIESGAEAGLVTDLGVTAILGKCPPS